MTTPTATTRQHVLASLRRSLWLRLAFSGVLLATIRRICEVLNRAVPTGQLTPEAAAAMDAQMQQMNWTGDV